MAELALKDVDLIRSGRTILSKISLVLRSGETVLVLGANGSGKSVLLITALGLLQPDRGTVSFNGSEIRRDDGELRRQTSVVFQRADIQLLGHTVQGDLELSLHTAGIDHSLWEELIEFTLERYGLDEYRHLHPSVLSGGFRRKLALASASIATPKIMFLDEPLLELDYPGRETFISHLHDLSDSGMGLVVTTHEYRSFWEFTDRVILLKNGDIAGDVLRDDAIPLLSRENGVVPW